MMDLSALCPKDEKVWVTYYGKNEEPLFFLTGPVNTSSTLTAQSGKFTLYSLVSGAKGSLKSKKLGQGGNPSELEMHYHVKEKMQG